MVEVKIKRESLATRCEICHKNDCYDSVNNTCLRCSEITIVNTNLITNHTKSTSLPNFLKNILLEDRANPYINICIKFFSYFGLCFLLYFLLLFLALVTNNVRISIESIGLDASQTESFVGFITPFDLFFATLLLGIIIGLIKFAVSFNYSKKQ